MKASNKISASGRFVRRFAIVFVFLFAIGAPSGWSQETEHEAFQVSVSLGIGFRGPQASTNLHLVDELGMHYDLDALLQDQTVRRQLTMSDEQFADITAKWQTSLVEMKTELLKNLSSDETRESVKEAFLALNEATIRTLHPDQISQLQIARHRLGIERFGLVKYLGSEPIRTEFGLTDSNLEALKLLGENSSELTVQTRSLLKKANRELLNSLSDSDRHSLRTFMNDESMRSFERTELYADPKPVQNSPVRSQQLLLRLTRIKNIRDSLSLDESTSELLADLSGRAGRLTDIELRKEIGKILEPEQLEKLYVIGTEKELARMGTVAVLSRGLIGQQIQLSEKEANRIDEVGSAIHAIYLDDVRTVRNDFVNQVLSSFSKENRVRLINIVGDVDLFAEQ